MRGLISEGKQKEARNVTFLFTINQGFNVSRAVRTRQRACCPISIMMRFLKTKSRVCVCAPVKSILSTTEPTEWVVHTFCASCPCMLSRGSCPCMCSGGALVHSCQPRPHESVPPHPPMQPLIHPPIRQCSTQVLLKMQFTQGCMVRGTNTLNKSIKY